MKILDRIIIIVFTLSIIFSTIWVVSIPTLKNKKYYLHRYNVDNVVENVEYTEEELNAITDEILHYLFKDGELEYQIDNKDVFDQEAKDYLGVLRNTYIVIQIIGTYGFLLSIGCICYILWRFTTVKRYLIKYVGLTLLVVTTIVIGYLFICRSMGIPEAYKGSILDEMRYHYYELIYGWNLDKINNIPVNNKVLNAIYSPSWTNHMIVRGVVSTGIILILWFVLAVVIQLKGKEIEDEFEKLKTEDFNS